MVWSELFSVKAVPNNSTLEGGGTLALVFYQQLPVGNKLVTFASRANPTLMLTQQAFVENALVLTTSIPKYPHPEEVDVRVFTAEGILLASTPFTYYDLNNSDLMLHILSQQLQSYFPAGTPGAGGMQGTAGVDGANGYVGGGGGYHVPNAVYQLLLGACRLGCEPLVACLLNLPAMKSITVNELQKACDIADGCGHTQLSAILLQMVTMHNMPYEQVLVSRGAGNEDDSSRASPQLHVDEYYTAMGKLARGGSSPREQAATVMSQLLKAIQVNKKEKEEKEKDAEQPPSVDQLASDMEKATISTAAQRRHSYLHHQPRSISDEDNDDGSSTVATVGDDDAARQGSRPSLSEQGDTVGPLPYDDHDRFSLHKGKFAQMSDADSAIGMSFEDDSQSLLLSEVQRRKSSSIVPADFVSASRDSNDMAITVKLPPDAGIEVSNTLNWKTAFFVSEDYPASSEHKIFYRGDQIIQVGGKAVSGLSREEFSELFDESLSAGTSVKILPQVDRMTEGKDGKMLRRMPSDHAIFDSITRRVNNLLTTKSSSTPRNVSIPHTSSGFGVKMIGGKSVGVFISDVRPDLSSVSPGDQVLEINGHRTQGLTLYQATQLLRMNTSDLNLSVVENKAKFQAVREQFELDSFYVRSRVDMPATSMRDMSLKKGLLLHVVNTVIYAPNYWLAWAVNEQTGMETHLRRIPSPAMAKRQFKSDIYDDVVRNTALFPRPVCLIGPDSQRVAAALATNKLFTNCSTLDEALRVFAKGTQHAVISTSDPAVVENMSAIHPIVLQTQAEEGASLMEQIKFSKFRVSALLSGGSTTEVAGQVIKKTNEQQHLPVWTTAGVLS